jgi:hypothetical protein
MPRNKDLNHYMQLRLRKQTVAEIDNAIATDPVFCGFSRCKFVRASVKFALYQLEEIQKAADSASREEAVPRSGGEE